MIWAQKRQKNIFPILTNDISDEAINQIKKREIEISTTEEEAIFLNLKNVGMENFLDFDNNDNANLWKTGVLSVKDSLYSNIVPRCADIMKDLKDKSRFDDPCVLLFRNAWYFFTDKGKSKLAKMFFKALKPGSSLIIGELDRDKIPPILIKQGFKRAFVSGIEQKYIFEKPLLNREC